MMHQFRDKKQIEKSRKITRNTIGLVVFVAVSALGIWTWSSGPLNNIGGPVWHFGNFISDKFYNMNYFFRTKASITKENHNLIEEISYLRTSLLDHQILEKENADLKELLGRIGDNSDFVLGNILSKPNHSPYDTLIIDIGINTGIKEGDVVYSSGITPIGSVEKVHEQTSLISLYTNPGRKTEGFIDILNVSVELTGRGGGNFEMVIPMELSVDKGTIIYLPGSNSKIIAYVDEIISSPTDPFKKVILSSPINIQNLKWVEVKKD